MLHSCLPFEQFSELFERHSRENTLQVVNLDFDARVPIPISVFPSSYRSDAVSETTHTRVEGEVNLPRTSRVEREDTRFESVSASPPQALLKPPKSPKSSHYEKSEVFIEERERQHEHRPHRREEIEVFEEEDRYRENRFPEVELSRERYQYQDPNRRIRESSHLDVDIDVDHRKRDTHYDRESNIDITEREYRRRSSPSYDIEIDRETTYPPPPPSHAHSATYDLEVDHQASYPRSTVSSHSSHKPHSTYDIEVDRQITYPQSSVSSHTSHRPHSTYEVEVDRQITYPKSSVSSHSHKHHPEAYDVEVDRTSTVSSRHQPREEFDISSHSGRSHFDIETDRRSAHPREVKVKSKTKAIYDVEEKPTVRMGYYDDEGHYHSFRRGVERTADRSMHPFHPKEDVVYEDEGRGPSRIREGKAESVRLVERPGPPNTITIPCHFIRIGDILILQGRPCQVIRISTSAQTGQHRYLGVDLFTKQLHEESSFVSNPSPSVVVQSMLGPVFKQYRVLDIRDDGRVVAMTESGDVKQGLPIIDQGGLWGKLNESFANGRGSVRVLVINDGGRELAVDYKVIHGSRL
ncbi:MAG: hypothetical protein M1834_004317 [Cirrosporium novae-zelandiae]|nr:MAG: hypothetical protein M1834_004317 [Cirrosporium novae-zelandiae]